MFRATGGTSYIRAVLPTPVNMESDSFTLACFMQVDSYVTGYGWNLYQAAGDSSYESAGTLTLAGPELQFRVRDGASSLNIGDLTPPSAGTIFPLVVTYDASLNSGEIFVNGASAGSGSLSMVGTSHETLAVGVVKTSGGLAPLGELRVAHVRAWSRVLTAQEISNYSNATSKTDIDAISSANLLSSADLVSDATVNSGPSFTETGAVYDGVDPLASAVPVARKSSTFDIETTLGTITTATLNGVNVFDHVTGQVGTTVSFAGAATDEITTSGEYSLVLGDGATTETITVQVNVYGVAPSNNPVQKDGAALASLTGVQVRVTAGSNLDGTQLEYLPTATTDASGNLSNIDLSSTAAADTDPVLLHMRTSAGDSIIASETVGLI